MSSSTTQKAEKKPEGLEITYHYQIFIWDPDADFLVHVDHKGQPIYRYGINGRQVTANSLEELTRKFNEYIEGLQKLHAKFVEEVEKRRSITVWL